MPRLPPQIHRTYRSFHIKYKKHIQVIRYNNSNLGYSSHILNIGHTYGTITDTTDIILTHKKGKAISVTGC
jgi:hypothetical protein